MFTYGVLDSSDDFIGSNEQLSARAQQVALGVGGNAEAALGVVVTTVGCGTVAGCAEGGPLGAWLAAGGADTAYKASEALSSPYVYLNGARVRDSFSEATNQEVLSPTIALLTNVSANLAGGVVVKRAGSSLLRDELPVVFEVDTAEHKAILEFSGGNPVLKNDPYNPSVVDLRISGNRTETIKLYAPEHWGNKNTLEDHFDRHASDFDISDPFQYADEANSFLVDKAKYESFIDAEGVARIYDRSTNTFGSYSKDGSTRTFYKPKKGLVYWESQLEKYDRSGD